MAIADHTVTAFAVAGLLVAAHLVPRRIMALGGAIDTVNVDEVMFVAVLLAVQTDYVLPISGLASLAGSVVLRRSVEKAVFNCGQLMVSAGVGVVVMWLLSWGSPADVTPQRVGAAIVGTLAMALTSNLAVTSMISFATRSSPRKTIQVLPSHGVAWVGATILGASATLLVFSFSWGFVLALALVGFVQRAYTTQLREAAARVQAERLQKATAALRATQEKTAIHVSTRQAAKDLLGAREATVIDPDSDAPLTGLTATMPSGRTLAVTGRLGPGNWTQQEREMLLTLAGVADDALRSADLISQLQTITDAQTEAVLAFDDNHRITFANPAAQRILARPDDLDVVGRQLDEVFQLHAEEEVLDLPEMLASKVVVEEGDALLVPFGSRGISVAFSFTPIHVGDDSAGAILVMRDVTERRGAQEALTYRALHDELTGLPNRRVFLDHLDAAMERSTVSGTRHGVLCVDLDRFKIVNDSFGHIVGDQLLVQVSDRLERETARTDTLARLAGDEFVMLIEDRADHVVLPRLAERILISLQQPYLVDGRTIFITVSIGMALTHQGQTRDEVMAAVDAATYAAKAAGRNCVRIATQALVDQARSRSVMEARLRQAIDNGDLSLRFQPIIDTRTQDLAGVEALARWEHPGGLSTSPAEFIPLAEDTGLIVTLGRWVLEESCRLTHAWNSSHPEREPIQVSVNLSALQLAQPRLADEVTDVLVRTGLAPEHLSLEITETAIFTDTEANLQAIRDLREIGVGVSVDDFGTGYSSLAYLRKLPVDTVKLDRAFIAGLGQNDVDTQIVASVMRLCKALGRNIIAEGVETELQWQTLARMGCPRMQGFLMAKPLTPEEFVHYWDRQYGPQLRIVEGGA